MTSKLTTISLPDICELVTDGTHDSPKIQSFGVPFIKGKHISSRRIDFENCDYITQEDHCKCIKRVKPKTNDVLFSNIGSVGDAARVTEEVDFSIKNVALFRPDQKKVDPFYFYYLVISPYFRGHFLNVRSGSAQPFISLESFRSLKFKCLEDKATQHKVGSILSAYDDLIENNRRRIQLLEEAARLLYKEWFVHLRFPGHDHVKITDGVPEGWDRLTIGNLATVFRGKSYKSSELREVGGRDFVNLKCIQRYGGFRSSGIKRFEGEHKDHHRVNGGDIVMAVTDMTRDAMIIAQAGRVPSSIGEGAIYSMDLVKIVPHPHIEPSWLYLLFRHSDFPFAVREHASGTNVLHLKPKYIEDRNTLVPPASLRRAFAEISDPILEEIDILESQILALARARDLLLPRLMNGEMVV